MPLRRPSQLPVSRFDGKKLLMLISTMVAAMMIDSEIGFVADFIAEIISSPAGIALFICISVIFAVLQYFIFGYVKKLREESTSKPLHLSLTHTAVTIAQYVLVAMIAFVILQILVFSQYNTIILYPVLFISYGLWIVTLALLSRALLSWYRLRAEQETKKSNMLVLVLSLSMVAYVVLGIITLISHVAVLPEQKSVVTSSDVAYFPGFQPEDFVSQVKTMVGVVSGIAYVMNWVGTVLLLRPYIQRLGQIKFWTIMGVVMVYYLASVPLFVLGYFSPSAAETDIDIMNNILIFSVGAVLSGILFGAAFLSIARTLKQGSALRNYMTITAYGMVLFYVTLQAQVTQAAYPPFGLVSTACVGLSTYLIYIGLYSSAVIVSQDLALRQSIRKSVTAQAKLLDSIGTAQMESELQRRVLTVAEKTSGDMAEKTGVEASMTEDEIKDYIEKVVKELESKR
jgi:hypothetical protein